MSFLMRGRSPWWRHDQTSPAPEPVAQATGLPVAAPAPAGVTDDLSASETKGQYANCGVFQVVMSDVMKPGFRAWLEARDLVMYVIPVVDDLPTFGIGPKRLDRGER